MCIGKGRYGWSAEQACLGTSKAFKDDYGVKLRPEKLRTYCEIDWISFRVGWPSEGSLDRQLIDKVFWVVTGRPRHPDEVPYIACWQDAVLSKPSWLKACLEENCKIMMVQVSASSKCRPNPKTIPTCEPEEIPSPYVPPHIYPPLPITPLSVTSTEGSLVEGDLNETAEGAAVCA